MRRLEAKEGQVVATCQVSGWSPSVSEGRVQRGHRGRWSLDRWASFLGFEGLEGESSQSDALSESAVSESEGEGGAVVEMGTRVRNWAALFFLDRKVLEGVPRRARF